MTETTPQRPPASRLRAAVVDDDRLTRFLVRRTLEAAGFTVDEADTGAAALRLAQGRPDVMVLDLHLPDMSGLAVCRAVIETVPVVFLTASDDVACAELCRRSGASDCVQKPLTGNGLAVVVAAVVVARQESVARALKVSIVPTAR